MYIFDYHESHEMQRPPAPALEGTLRQKLPSELAGRAKKLPSTVFASVFFCGLWIQPIVGHATETWAPHCKDDFSGSSAKELSDCIRDILTAIGQHTRAATDNGRLSIISAGEVTWATGQGYRTENVEGAPVQIASSQPSQFTLDFGDKGANAFLLVTASGLNGNTESTVRRNGKEFAVELMNSAGLGTAAPIWFILVAGQPVPK
jgi:hypothetical protein